MVALVTDGRERVVATVTTQRVVLQGERTRREGAAVALLQSGVVQGAVVGCQGACPQASGGRPTAHTSK